MTELEVASFDVNATFAGGNPYPVLARYRHESPVHLQPRTWEEQEDQPTKIDVFLFRHADCMTWLRDPRLGHWERPPEADQPPPDTFSAVANHFMLFRNPPVHTRLRGVANLAFTPRKVEKQRASVEQIANHLASEMRSGEQPAELIGQFAFPLPMLVIAGVLGIPDHDYRKFRSLAADLAAAIDFPVEGLETFLARVDQSTAELSEYLRHLIAARRADPREDLLSTLIHAVSEEGRLSEEELIGTCILLLVAGHETTVNLIGNGTLALLRYPDQWAALRDDPSLARNASEELLRYDAPVQFTTRLVMEDVDLDGQHIPAGSVFHLMLSSANRDESAFTEPDTLDIRRDVGRIMSFGMGIHFCLGAPLARLEGEVAFATLVPEFPNLSLATDEPQWRPGAIFHGLAELPLNLE
jgi:cytochrome P450